MTFHHVPLRAVVAALTSVAVLIGSAAHAQNLAQDVEQQMNDLYNGMVKMPGDIIGEIKEGTLVSEPSAFHGQVWNTYSGGRVAKRLPVKSIQLVNLDMPRFSAGCGGIDLYAGSLSHLNAAEFVQFLKASAMNTTGVITQVALSAITPLLGSTLAEAKNIVDRINGMMMNSCELAQTAVHGAVDHFTAARNENCIQGAMMHGNKDRNEATQLCGTTAGQNEWGSKLPPFSGNLTWEMLKKANIQGSEAMLIMNLLGTRIYHKPGKPNGTNSETTVTVQPPQSVPPQLDLAMLVSGTGDAQSNGTIQMQLWVCEAGGDACLQPTLQMVTVSPFTAMVKNNLKALREAVVNRDTPGEPVMRFVNSTPWPVAKMAQVGTRDSFAFEHLVEAYGDIIAMDYASAMIRNLVDTFLVASRAQFNLTKEQEEIRDMIVAFARERVQAVEAEKAQASASVAEFNQTLKTMEDIERRLRPDMHLAGLYGHGALLSGWR